MAEPFALAALAVDAAVGWPAGLYRRIGHPVGLFARLVDALEAMWNRHDRSQGMRRFAGIATVTLLLILVTGTAWALQHISMALFDDWGWLALALLAWPALAQRSLFDHVRKVGDALAEQDLSAARTAVGAIVGRDTASLDEGGIVRAAIESLAESFCDGVVAPLFWLLVLGLPGIWAYKAVNTADSLIGHREERWRAFGWAAARTDDVMNLIPARLAGVLICLAGRGGWLVLRRDAGKHASPNAGWPEAAMAGALRLRLAGPVAYDGIMHDKPWIGDGSPHASAFDIDRALRIYLGACAMLWLMAGGFQWAL